MNTRIRNAEIAKENEKIIQNGCYETAGKIFPFSHPLFLLHQAEIYEMEALEALKVMMDSGDFPVRQGRISVTEGETFDVPGEAVLNFANAFTPGGGYLYGASSQEEALCRESTLYASLTGKKGMAYYEENRRRQSIYGSEYILLSPFVEIFRKADGSLFGPPRKTAVITAPAIDLRGPAGRIDTEEIAARRRMRIGHILALAAAKGYKTLTLGAWGCGVFLNPADEVASDFYKVLVEEGYRFYFDDIVFAIYCPGDKGNLEAFRERFSCILRAKGSSI
ncbi:TIGR02452 family protein [uncultured Dialister sp.]|uniref:TIGR02452 family protein n=1 Tax=uncultured Dialister sp. TaxID=278064 RepID=UPI00260FC563|nr:TIGR02452 family protein [uncultured Dialister sp.]